MPISTAGNRPPSSERGFTYAVVLVSVVVLGILAEMAAPLTSHVMQADREVELLFRGQAYRRAIQSYYETGGMFPRSLDDLLTDPRSANKHHIRALYPDPMATDKAGWTVVRATDGGISGVASSSGKAPIKRANFPVGLEKFEGANAYSDWIFEYVPPRIPSPPPGSPLHTVPVGPPAIKTN